MTDPRIAEALEREHREIDAGLADFARSVEEGAPRVEPLQSAATALRRHIYVEEEMLFPALRAAGLFGPVAVMIREHGEIWAALDDLEARAHAGADGGAGGTSEAYRVLAALLESHNEKEEVILYPQSDAVVDADVRQRVEDYLATGELPEGWTCQALA